MAISKSQTEIEAQPEAIFAYVCDLEKHADWSGGKEIKKISEGALAVGSVYETTEEGPVGITFKEKVEVIQHRPTDMFAWRSYGPFGSWYDWSFEIRGRNRGAVLVERLDNFHGLPAGVALKLFVRRQMEKSMPQGLAKIKKKLETQK